MEGGRLKEKLALVRLYRRPTLENVSVDVVDCTRVKGVLEGWRCPSVPGSREGVKA